MMFSSVNIHSIPVDADGQSFSHAQVASDNPFLPLRDFPALVQKTILPMLVEKSHSDLQLDSDGLGAFTIFSRKVLCRAKFGIKDGFAPNNTSCWSSQIDKQRPSRFCWCWGARGKYYSVRFVILS